MLLVDPNLWISTGLQYRRQNPATQFPSAGCSNGSLTSSEKEFVEVDHSAIYRKMFHPGEQRLSSVHIQQAVKQFQSVDAQHPHHQRQMAPGSQLGEDLT